MRWRWPHFHSDPDWQADLHAYYQCRCGARRTRRLYSNIDGPERDGWPQLVNSHGMPINDTGWRPLIHTDTELPEDEVPA